MLEMGAAIIGIKLGPEGMFLRTTKHRHRLSQTNRLNCLYQNDDWVEPAACSTNFPGGAWWATTGAGDCAVAGFLTGLARGMSAEDTLISAVAVGACNVEAMDATSGILPWDEVQARIQSGWARREIMVPMRDWVWESTQGLWIGPDDRGGYLQ